MTAKINANCQLVQQFYQIPDLDKYLVLGWLLLFGLLETFSGALSKTRRSFGDWIQEVGNFALLAVFTKPGIVLLVIALGEILAPQLATALSAYNIWLVMLGYLLIDDLLQYLYHRAAHERPFLWKLHRAHHQAEEMGFFVSYRNAALYYAIMPNIWWIGLVTFLGGGIAVAIGLVIKLLIVVSAHSTLAWDAPLYRIKWLSPFMSVIERIIVTPAFHHAHHGQSQLDGVSDPNGNFGNMFSIWDQLFGSAKFTRQFPTDYGMQKPTDDHWTAPMFYPLVKSSDPASELHPDHVKMDRRSQEPATISAKQGEAYLWCRCGRSAEQPFCDGSHNGTPYKPLRFEASRTGRMSLCNCKRTQTPPYCDGSHKN